MKRRRQSGTRRGWGARQLYDSPKVAERKRQARQFMEQWVDGGAKNREDEVACLAKMGDRFLRDYLLKYGEDWKIDKPDCDAFLVANAAELKAEAAGHRRAILMGWRMWFFNDENKLCEGKKAEEARQDLKRKLDNCCQEVSKSLYSDWQTVKKQEAAVNRENAIKKIARLWPGERNAALVTAELRAALEIIVSSSAA